MSAFGRAYHAENEKNPVFCDNFARRLMTDDEYAAMRGYILGGLDFFAPEKKGSFKNDDDALRFLINTHIAPTPLCRSAYCEAALKTAVRTDTTQYVILGAGLDSFAFREGEFCGKYKIFEVDHPKTQQDKLARIERAGLKVPENLTFVGVDFTKDSLSDALMAAGFDRSAKTFFSWLGVSYYLYADKIGNMLAGLAGLCADGSTLVFDYADAGLFLAEETRVQNMLKMAEAGGEPMRSSFDYISIDSLLAEHGFLVYELLTPAEIQSQIIAGRDMTAFEHINYILAVHK